MAVYNKRKGVTIDLDEETGSDAYPQRIVSYEAEAKLFT